MLDENGRAEAIGSLTPAKGSPGAFQLETDEGLLPVRAGEFVIVPKGTPHRPVVTELTKFLMVELDGTLNKENSGDLYED